MIKVSDFVMRFVAQQGVRHLFMVTGGGAMHLNDSAGRVPELEFVCNLHEQASAIAAEAYAKVNENLGVALVTTGPGSTNAITGVAGAWQDSTPCLFLSGQVKRADIAPPGTVRQLGVQEIDIVSLVKPITKYAVTVMEPTTIRFHLEKAVHLARTGRPGPVWIDIPIDVQGATVDEAALGGYSPDVVPAQPEVSGAIAEALVLLRKAQRPVLLAGNGIRLGGAKREFYELIEKLQIPVLLTWPAQDFLPHNHHLLVGRPGAVAPRAANYALQNSDFLLSIGARLDMVITGYSHPNFARAAKKVLVDIDPAEIAKMKAPIDVPVCCDAKVFIKGLIAAAEQSPAGELQSWWTRCREWQKKYPVITDEYRSQTLVSTYHFAEVLAEETADDDIIVSGSSGAGIEIFLLAYDIKGTQRIFLTTALGAMGFGPPAAIGASLAAGRRRTICVDGDGGLQLNIQELQTISRLNLPVKLFVLNNCGYSSIRTSQSRYFGRLTGADDTSGVTLPPLQKIADAYSVAWVRVNNQGEMRKKIREVLDSPGPVLCELMVQPDEPRAPSLASMQKPDGSMVSRPLEDLWPFLERDEFRSNMIIPPIEE